MNKTEGLFQLAERVRERLTLHHQGAENGIRGVDLATQLGVDDRLMRKAVVVLRDASQPIGAHPDWGYYFAVTGEEIDLCRAFLRARWIRTAGQEAKLAGTELPVLLERTALKLRTEGR